MNTSSLLNKTSLRAALGAFWVLAAGGALAAPADSPDASIPFANHGGIVDWQADKDRGVWVQDVHRRWYYAKLMGPCIGLNFANSIGFDVRSPGNFDRFSAIFVPGSGRCAVQSFTASDGPKARRSQPVGERSSD